MASKQLQAKHAWQGPEGNFDAGDLIPDVSAEREKELVDGGYAQTITAKEAKELAASAATDLPGQ